MAKMDWKKGPPRSEGLFWLCWKDARRGGHSFGVEEIENVSGTYYIRDGREDVGFCGIVAHCRVMEPDYPEWLTDSAEDAG